MMFSTTTIYLFNSFPYYNKIFKLIKFSWDTHNIYEPLSNTKICFGDIKYKVIKDINIDIYRRDVGLGGGCG